MTNFEHYLENLDEDTFIESMILNCEGCPAYPCVAPSEDMPIDGSDCIHNLEGWCERAYEGD